MVPGKEKLRVSKQHVFCYGTSGIANGLYYATAKPIDASKWANWDWCAAFENYLGVHAWKADQTR
jgi:hypothetical protein